jgi:hypothetical protein
LDAPAAAQVLEWTDLGSKADLAAAPLGIRYNFTQTAFLRTSWDDSTALYLGLKGGNNQLQQLGKATTHTHADQGSFVFDHSGLRWATDLGNVAQLGCKCECAVNSTANRSAALCFCFA